MKAIWFFSLFLRLLRLSRLAVFIFQRRELTVPHASEDSAICRAVRLSQAEGSKPSSVKHLRKCCLASWSLMLFLSLVILSLGIFHQSGIKGWLLETVEGNVIFFEII